MIGALLHNGTMAGAYEVLDFVQGSPGMAAGGQGCDMLRTDGVFTIHSRALSSTEVRSYLSRLKCGISKQKALI